MATVKSNGKVIYSDGTFWFTNTCDGVTLPPVHHNINQNIASLSYNLTIRFTIDIICSIASLKCQWLNNSVTTIYTWHSICDIFEFFCSFKTY